MGNSSLRVKSFVVYMLQIYEFVNSLSFWKGVKWGWLWWWFKLRFIFNDYFKLNLRLRHLDENWRRRERSLCVNTWKMPRNQPHFQMLTLVCCRVLSNPIFTSLEHAIQEESNGIKIVYSDTKVAGHLRGGVYGQKSHSTEWNCTLNHTFSGFQHPMHRSTTVYNNLRGWELESTRFLQVKYVDYGFGSTLKSPLACLLSCHISLPFPLTSPCRSLSFRSLQVPFSSF